MSNEDFLNNNQANYESLRYFKIQNEILIFNDGKITYTLPIPHLNLFNLNASYTGLFLLNPSDIFNLLYMLELFYKPNITDYDINFIKNYVSNYLNIKQKYLDGNKDYEFLSMKLGIPIDVSYCNGLDISQAGQIIQEANNTYSNNSQGKGLKLVRTNGITNVEDSNVNNTYGINYENYDNYLKTGFITFLLIAGTVIATCIYPWLSLPQKPITCEAKVPFG